MDNGDPRKGLTDFEQLEPLQTIIQLPIPFGGAKELGIVYINIIRGAKEPRNLQNHRGDKPSSRSTVVYFLSI